MTKFERHCIAPEAMAARPPAPSHATDRGQVAALVASATAGDRTAWEGLVQRFAGLVWAVARAHRLDPADASDVSGYVWSHLAGNLGRITDPERLGLWLASETHNECLGRLQSASPPAKSEGPDTELLLLLRTTLTRRTGHG